MSDDLKACRSCDAPIRWRSNSRTGKRAPINAEPSTNGNIILSETDTYRVLSFGEEPAEPRYTNHFVTCPNAKQHAKEAAPIA